MKEWEEEIVAMNRHRFDESNDLIFTVFIIVIKTFPQWNPSILIFAIEAIVVEYYFSLDNFISIFLYVKRKSFSGNSNRIDSIINILIRYSH